MPTSLEAERAGLRDPAHAGGTTEGDVGLPTKRSSSYEPRSTTTPTLPVRACPVAMSCRPPSGCPRQPHGAAAPGGGNSQPRRNPPARSPGSEPASSPPGEPAPPPTPASPTTPAHRTSCVSMVNSIGGAGHAHRRPLPGATVRHAGRQGCRWCPQKPKLFFTATSIFICRASLAQ